MSEAPIVVAGNKADVKPKDRKVKANHNSFQRKHGLTHVHISTESGSKIDLPLLHLARALVGDKRLRFVTATSMGAQKTEAQTSPNESDLAALTLDSPAKRSNDIIQEAKALPLPPSRDGL